MKKSYFILALLGIGLSSLVFAGGSPAEQAELQKFSNVLLGWTNGVLGKVLALSMLLVGCAVGVTKNSPILALTGAMGASFISFGPAMVAGIVGVDTNANVAELPKQGPAIVETQMPKKEINTKEIVIESKKQKEFKNKEQWEYAGTK